MSAKSLGVLTLDLVARIGGFTGGLTQAERASAKRAKEIERQWKEATTNIGLALTGVGTAATAAFVYIKAGADAIASYQDLAEKIGDTATAISGLQLPADVSGTSMETIAAASVKLTATLTGVDDESKSAGAAIKALGLDLERFKGMTPTAQLEAVAEALGKFQDGAQKTAVAVALFGKTGAQLLPFLNDLAELGTQQNKLTAEQIDQADKLSKEFAKLESNARSLSREINSGLIQSISKLVAGYKEIKALGAFDLVLKDAAKGVVGLQTRLDGDPGEKINQVLQERIRLQKDLDFATRKGFATRDLKRDLDELDRYLEVLRGKQARIVTDLGSMDTSDALSRRGPKLPVLDYRGPAEKAAGGAAKDPLAEAKRYLESLQKQLEKTKELSVEEQTLTDITMKRLGAVTPALEKQILGTARLIDLSKAQAANLKESEEAAKKAAAAAGALFEEAKALALSVETPTERLSRQLTELGKIAENNPLLSLETQARVSTKIWEEYTDSIKTAGEGIEKLDSFATKAAENIQDQLGAGLADIMDGNYKNIGQGFTKMINRMVAESVAADLSRHLFGDLLKGGSGDGIFGAILKNFAGFNQQLAKTTGDFARMDRGQSSGGGTGGGGGWLDAIGKFFAGFFAEGGNIPAGHFGLVGERGAEFISGPATITPMDKAGPRQNITLNYHAAPGESRATASQRMADGARQLQIAAQRNL